MAPRGGARKGAGRPSGQGRYGEPTVPVRVPASLVGKVKEALVSGTLAIPLYSTKVAAGFPSPAEDFVVSRLDANELVLDNPGSCYFLQVVGESMRDAGILPGDYIVVDRSRQAVTGDIVVAAIDGEFTVKRLGRSRGRPVLQAAHPDYPPIVPDEEVEINQFGVVCGVVRRLAERPPRRQP